MWFCRDLWTDAAKDGLKEKGRKGHKPLKGAHKRDLPPMDEVSQEQTFIDTHSPSPDGKARVKRDDTGAGADAAGADEAAAAAAAAEQVKRDEAAEARRAEDEQSSSDQDAIDEDAANPAPEPLKPLPDSAFLIPNSAFTAARILVNPRCVTTYGGVSHTQLALDLFGGERDEPQHRGGNYVLEDWAGPPDSFVCQEMRTTGGRTAPKSQRRVGFLLQNEVGI